MPASDAFSADQGVTLAYRELSRLATTHLRANGGWSLEPAALVNEAYIRLAQWEGVHWKNRAHFVGVAAMVMRQVVCEYARRRNALKRADWGTRVTLHSGVAGENGALDAIVVEQALRRLQTESPEACRIIELRVFGGLTVPEVASVLGYSESTVKRHWVFAKTWLRRNLFNHAEP